MYVSEPVIRLFLPQRGSVANSRFRTEISQVFSGKILSVFEFRHILAAFSVIGPIRVGFLKFLEEMNFIIKTIF